MIIIILSLIACGPETTAETTTTTTQHISIEELEITFEDRNGTIQAPAGEIISASMCYERSGILMCQATAWGISPQENIHIDLLEGTMGVLQYIITE